MSRQDRFRLTWLWIRLWWLERINEVLGVVLAFVMDELEDVREEFRRLAR